MSGLRFDRHGWRGIGVPVTTLDSDDAFVALALDFEPDEIALSVWATNGPGHRREFAVWLSRDAARKLAAELAALADATE